MPLQIQDTNTAYEIARENEVEASTWGPSARNLIRRAIALGARTLDEFAANALLEVMMQENGRNDEEWGNVAAGMEASEIVNTRMPFRRIEELHEKASARMQLQNLLLIRALILGWKEKARKYSTLSEVDWDGDWKIDLLLGEVLGSGGTIHGDVSIRPFPDGTPAGWCRLPGSSRPSPRFLSDADHSDAVDEREALQRAGASGTYLCREALVWAKKHPKDPRTPELLHRAVRSTRSACGDEETEEAAQAAFSYLHRRYPNSEWAKRTPYYDGGRIPFE